MKDIVASGAGTGGSQPRTAPGGSQPRTAADGWQQPPGQTVPESPAEPEGSQAPAEPGGWPPPAEPEGSQVPAAQNVPESPAEPEGSQVLAAELLGAISAVRRVARRTVRSAWHEEPLPPAQSELLRLAAARPGISVADAARELRLAPNTVSTLVGRLTTAGLLGRTRSASDGRSVRLAVTGKATRRIAGFRDLRADLAGRALDRLTASDRQALAGAVPALLRLAAQLEEEGA